VDAKGRLGAWPKKNAGFGWDAVRIPFRVGLDHFWYGRPEAAAALGPLAGFIAGEWSRNARVSCEYRYDGKVEKKFENPAFYAAYYWALAASDFPLAGKLLAKTRDFPDPQDGRLYGPGYYVNSLAWLGEGLASGLIHKTGP
jgi:endoglucanase